MPFSSPMLITARQSLWIFTSPMFITLLREWSPVERLLAYCRPSHIARLIVAVIIWISIKRHSGRSLAQIVKERLEIIFPFLAHRYATTAIIFKTCIRRVEASRLCVLPRCIFRRGTTSSILTMFNRLCFANFSVPAATARTFSINERLSIDLTLSSACTPTKPKGFSLTTADARWSTCNNLPSRKILVDEIKTAHISLYQRRVLSAIYI